MADEVVDIIPIWQSQRGVILIIGMFLLFLLIVIAMAIEAIYDKRPDTLAIGVFATLVSGGGLYFFKDKAVEAAERIGRQ